MPMVGGPFSPLRVGDAQPTDGRSRTFRRAVSANSYVIVPTGAGSLSTPDSASLDITGDIDIAVRLKVVTGAVGRLVTKGYSGTYCFGATDTVVFSEFNVGGGPFYPASAAHSVSNGSLTWLRLTRVASSGLVTHYKAADSVGVPSSWTSIGSTSSTTGSLSANSSALFIGSGTGGAEAYIHNIYRVVVKNGIDGTTVADFNPNLYATGSTFTSTDGLVYTLTGTAAITKA